MRPNKNTGKVRPNNPDKVRPKKSLGQHFLHDEAIARKIVEGLTAPLTEPVLEIGPGTGVLTKYLLEMGRDLKVAEIDRDSVAYLKKHYPALDGRIIEGDFLQLDLGTWFAQPFAVIGNFPYNISSQIFFRLLDYRAQVSQVVCMLQKEVADRLAAKHGNKTYGILSVILQTYYHIDYLFQVSPGVFTPPPKVMSAVIRLRRNERTQLGCDPAHFVKVVKQGFNTRRKTLRNALKNLNLTAEVSALPVMDKRAEQLSVEEFIHLSTLIEQSRGSAANH
jgi:16S rRNA (adenine1518-N6/adenine1519-N6)-dimethyltransferase